MCGICGIVRFEKIINYQEIKQFNDQLVHRGPDGEGIWQNTNQRVALGHRRLSILDLSDAGHQPMISKDGRYIIVLNGEIYNFLEIRQQLSVKGYTFKSESDTEVILNAYQEWGVEMLHLFNGMWALAIFDNMTNQLLLSRDRYGVKPLYYYCDKAQFVFASEVSAIHKFLGNKLELNTKVINQIIAGSGIFHGTDQTHLKDVKSLPAGYLLTLTDGNYKVKDWYQLKKKTIPNGFNKQTNDLKELIYEACKLRLRSDVPIGTCLSGGVDSGSIASIISTYNIRENERFSNYSHQSFCASFPGTPIDESDSARRLSNQMGLNLDVFTITPPTENELENALHQWDGPNYAMSFYPVWKLYEHIKSKGITVTLDGQGPDEMLGGYNYAYPAFEGAWQKKNPFWFHDVYKTYSNLGESNQFSSNQFVQGQYKLFLANKKAEVLSDIKDPAKNLLRKIGIYNKPPLEVATNLWPPLRNASEFKNKFDKHLFNVFTHTTLPGILYQYDRSSMAHGIECRTPFLDYRIVEYIFSLPVEVKLGGGYTKRILREAMKGVLPDETRLNKRKIGFTAPVVDWFKHELSDWMQDQMYSSEFKNNTYFDGKLMCQKYEDFIKSDNENWNYPWQFWPPIHLAWWMNHVKSFNAISNI